MSEFYNPRKIPTPPNVRYITTEEDEDDLTQAELDALNAKIAALHEAGDIKGRDAYFPPVREFIQKFNPNYYSEEDTTKKD